MIPRSCKAIGAGREFSDALTAKAGQDVRVLCDWMGLRRVCPIISGLVGLPRLVLLYLDTGLAYGKVLSVAQD